VLVSELLNISYGIAADALWTPPAPEENIEQFGSRMLSVQRLFEISHYFAELPRIMVEGGEKIDGLESELGFGTDGEPRREG